MPFPPLIGYLLAGMLQGFWALLPIYLVNLLYELAPPVLTRYIQEETYSDKRATVLSIGSFLFRISCCLFGPIIGFIAHRVNLESAFFAAAGIASLVIIGLIPFFLRRLKKGEEDKSRSVT